MKRMIAFLMVLVSLLATTSFAEVTDYSFLDGLSLTELEALQTEIDKRIVNARNSNAFADPSNLGMWELQYYVDEFKLPTDDGYIINSQYIEGTFSNSATTDSKLYVEVLVDDAGDVCFFMYEYGRNLVKNSSSRNRAYYDVIMMDNDGKRHTLRGHINSNGDRLNFDDETDAKIIAALSANGTVRFSIQEDDGMDSYLFAIKDTSYFSNAYNKLMKK